MYKQAYLKRAVYYNNSFEEIDMVCYMRLIIKDYSC